MKKIGWIGTGTMGAHMARNLHVAGYQVTAYNRSSEKLQPLAEAGLKVTSVLKEAVEEQDVVITMVSDDAAVKELYTQEQGLFAYSATETLLVNMSTVSPQISKQLAQMANDQGLSMLDAPVSGSENAAQAAQLVILVGGQKSSYERLEPVFQSMGKKHLYFGEAGAGSQAKLVINLYLGISMQGIAEALVVAEKFSLDREIVLQMMQESALSSPFLSLKKESLIKEAFPAMFALKYMNKDLGLVNDELNQMNESLPVTTSTYQSYTAARDAGYGEEDLAAIFAALLAKTGDQ